MEYSKVPNKRGATFINYRKNFQGLCSYLEGVRLLVLTKYFLQVRKVGFKIPNSMKFILFEEGGYPYLRGVCLLFLPNFPGGTFIWGATLIRNSRVHRWRFVDSQLLIPLFGCSGWIILWMSAFKVFIILSDTCIIREN